MGESKSVLITGGTGSFGQAMLRRLLEDSSVTSVRVLSRDEAKQWDLRERLDDDRVTFMLGDVRDAESVRRAVRDVDQVFHAAALHGVPSSGGHLHERPRVGERPARRPR